MQLLHHLATRTLSTVIDLVLTIKLKIDPSFLFLNLSDGKSQAEAYTSDHWASHPYHHFVELHQIWWSGGLTNLITPFCGAEPNCVEAKTDQGAQDQSAFTAHPPTSLPPDHSAKRGIASSGRSCPISNWNPPDPGRRSAGQIQSRLCFSPRSRVYFDQKRGWEVDQSVALPLLVAARGRSVSTQSPARLTLIWSRLDAALPRSLAAT